MGAVSKALNETFVSPQAYPNRLQILVAVVRYKTKMFKPRAGLCSTWLASLDPAQGLSQHALSDVILIGWRFVFLFSMGSVRFFPLVEIEVSTL